jgi:hypothetical protein
MSPDGQDVGMSQTTFEVCAMAGAAMPIAVAPPTADFRKLRRFIVILPYGLFRFEAT